ncbi:hypothetical protein DM01DRAFT_1411542 [Hesseltinella vesiculosa]|uniref:CUE domain-containing protein n=1 Tax=Hesseltinella vesiculosa TaxID=101127 RepID=A0A1X2G3F8_9FUNG|nr:hypothetical protein DM01DRAFT_1411542 [Hesseltinella vesiculosa]
MLLPYISPDSQGITVTVWQKAITIWQQQLVQWLSMDNADFEKVIQQDDLASWILETLQQQLDNDNVDGQLLRGIFLVYMRIGNQTPATPSKLTTMTGLDTFALVYARTNPHLVNVCVSHILTEQHVLADQYQQSLDPLLTLLDAWAGQLPSLAAQWQAHPDDLDDMLLILDRVLVLARLLEAKVTCSRPLLTQLIPTVMQCYQLLTDNLPSLPLTESAAGHRIFLIKQCLVHAFDTMVSIKFIDPLRAADGEKNNEALTTLAVTLSEDVLEWVEQCEPSATKTSLLDAPLLVDWQVECNFSQQCHDLNKTIFHDDNEQLGFLALVFDSYTADMSPWKLKQMQHHPISTPMTMPNSVDSTAYQQQPQPQPDTNTAELIAQIKDMFPDLGDGFIQSCLAANDNQAEQVIMQLLEDNLPPALASLDRSMSLLDLSSFAAVPPSSTNVLDSRHNVFDNDAFDVFAGKKMEKDNVIVGKKDKGTTDTMLKEKKYTSDEKSKWLQRVYDMYDDEIDDTYDSVNEVSGPVDLAAVDESGGADLVRKTTVTVDPGVLNEKELVHVFVDHPDVFERSANARRSKARDALRKKTDMTDEQLEGWAIMFNRNPRKQRILDNYRLFDGSQDAVGTETKIQQSQSQSSPKPTRPPPSEAKQQAYKEKNKARFANHQRKKMHDKKLAKAAPPAL